jgi:hypothetical protein
MHPTKLLLTAIFIGCLLPAWSQDYNPYKSIGKKAKVLTLSNGKYNEFFDTDSIQRIGTVLFNIYTKRIVKLLNAESTYKKASDNSSASRWYSIDPLAGTFKNSSYSPYCFVADNPILYVDPDGRDWYKDNKGAMQFDPSVQSQKDLKDGQKYVGDTYQDKNKKGKVTTDYRSDGSIMFSSQKDAYKRMYNNSKDNGNREEYGVVTKKGVLVLPDYKNNNSTSEIKEYGYDFKNGNIVDPLDGKEKTTLGTIHTHLSKGGDPTPSFEDDKYGAQKTPYKIFMTMGWDNKVHGNYGYYAPGDNTASYSDVDSYLKQGGLTNTDLLNGYDLIKALESIIIKK